MSILHDISYNIMYILSYIEILINKLLRVFLLNRDNEETVYLINTENMEVQILNDFDTDIVLDYEFGIVETRKDDKVSQYLFEELDTEDIPNMFNEVVDKPFLSC